MEVKDLFRYDYSMTSNPIFRIDRQGTISWVLIDTEKTWNEQTHHNLCVCLKNCIIYNHEDSNSKFLTKDSSLPKLNIQEYFNVSSILKSKNIKYNKKLGILEELNK